MLGPMLAYIGFVLIAYMPAVLIVRVLLTSRGTVRASYWKSHHGDAPAIITNMTRHLSNMFEFPILFYVLCIVVSIAGLEDSTYTTLAWGYVAARVAHCVIHVTYNYVPHRLVAFAVSQALLGGIFVRVVLAYTNGRFVLSRVA